VTLKEYAARIGLDVQMLYQLRKPLVRKGALGPVRRAGKEAPTAQKLSAFLPVRVVSAGPTPGSATVACRLVHPSGWVLECGRSSTRKSCNDPAEARRMPHGSVVRAVIGCVLVARRL
jgi:hypothetical protein